MSDFSSLGLSRPVLDAITELGFEQPTAIQQQAIPYLLSGEGDLVGLAQTGTGKTAAFGLPAIDTVDQAEDHPQVLVLAPTRELCVQITKDMQAFALFKPLLKIVPVYGGADIVRQIKGLRAGAQVVVATPGRLRDLINRRAVKLDQIKVLVLDEADEMLNMGFKEEIDEILETVSDERKTWLFSATMPKEVRRLTKDYMNDPEEIKAGNTNETNKNIDHQYVLVRPRERFETLRRFIDTDPNIYGLVFCRTRAETQQIADDLMRAGYPADVLNGDLSQAQRDRAMGRFRDGRVRVLVATDVAARGLDVDGITHVFHMNIPDEWAYYTHRSGRTGRAGRKGKSIMFMHPNDRQKLRQLDRKLKLDFTEIGVPSIGLMVEQRMQNAFTDLSTIEINPALKPLIEKLQGELEAVSKNDLIAKIAAQTFSLLPDHYQKEAERSLIKAAQSDSDDLWAKVETKKTRKPSNYQRIFVNVGTKEIKDIPEFITFVSEFGGIERTAIGQISLQEKHTFFDVDKKIASALVNKFKGAELYGRELRMNFDDGKPQGRSGKRSRGGSDRRFSKKRSGGGTTYRGKKTRGNFRKKRFAKE